MKSPKPGGGLLMRWGDAEIMWMYKAETAGTEIEGEKDKNERKPDNFGENIVI